MISERNEHTTSKALAGLCGVVSLVATNLSSWLLNACVYSQVASFAPWTREVNTFFGALLLVALVLVARRRPAWLDTRLMMVIVVGGLLCSTLLLALAVPAHDTLFTLIGLLFGAFAGVWSLVLLASTLTILEKPRLFVAIAAVGLALGDLMPEVLPLPDFMGGLVARSACLLIALVVSSVCGTQVVKRIAQGDAASYVEMAHPTAFLKPTHRLFVCSFFFSVANGFALAFNQIGNMPLTTGFAGIILAVVACWALVDKQRDHEDTLFSVAVLLVIGGFLVAATAFGHGSTLPNALLAAGSDCFLVLLWAVIASVGSRNLLALVPVLGIARAAVAAGTAIGAMVGHSTNELVLQDTSLATAPGAIALFLFVAFLWIGFRKFSFTETIQGVKQISTTQAPTASTEMVEQRCIELGEARGLTKREIEIFTMMAKGRNARFIKDHYVVSHNTVKSHIKHIYQKLDIHSQQELIDLVEGTEESAVQ